MCSRMAAYQLVLTNVRDWGSLPELVVNTELALQFVLFLFLLVKCYCSFSLYELWHVGPRRKSHTEKLIT